MTLNPARTGVALGAVIAAWHALWCLLVLVGAAQPLLDFVFWAHSLKSAFVVEPFDAVRAVVLLVVTFLIGWAMGAVFAVAWNRVHRRI